jgi:ribosomal protein L11 methyltransferase
MIYYRYKFILEDISQSDILVAYLAEQGFESFVEQPDGVEAFINEQLNTELLPETIEQLKSIVPFSFSFEQMKDINWNEEWEKNYEMVVVDGLCSVRAPFHQKLNGIQYDLVIEPKMSFGTAHHETTHQMIQYLLETDVNQKSVLDMGCGTCVLAILAVKKGAEPIVAIDNDEWAYNNSLENIQLNNTADIQVILGDSSTPDIGIFDVIIANINRNVLLNDISYYSDHIKPAGTMLLSGFYLNDLPMIKEKAGEYGFKLEDHKEKNNWVAARFTKA